MQIESKEIEKRIGYRFRDKQLLITAFTHSSFANRHGTVSNERLEFLGDSILNFITTEFLYNNFNLNEGELSKIKAYLVSAENLHKAMKTFNVIDALQCTTFHPNVSVNVMSDLYEAILGAVYLDSDLKTCKNFVINSLKFSIQDIEETMLKRVDYKTKLQEFIQQSGKNKLQYQVVEKTGKPHKPTFKIAVKLNGQVLAVSSANSKKIAENTVAKAAYLQLTEKK